MVKKLIISCIFAMLTIFAACSNSEQPKIETVEKKLPATPDQIKTVSFPETFKKEFENVSFDTKLIIKNKDKMTGVVTTNATLQVVDKEKAFQEFFAEKSSYETEETEYENEKGEKIKMVDYISPEGSRFYCGPSSSAISYMNPRLTPYIYSAFRLSKKDERYNPDQYSTQTDFSFATQAEAFADIKDKLSKSGIEIEESYKAYALDYKTMEQEEYSMGDDGEEDSSYYKEQWTEDDNCYYFLIGQEYNCLPVYYVYAEVFKEVEEENAPIQVLYSKNGIENIQVDRMFKFGADTKQVTLIDFEKIAQTVVNKYGMILGDSSYKVKTATLYYMVDILSGKGIYEVNPVWILDIEENTPDEGVISNVQMVINAVTAEEII